MSSCRRAPGNDGPGPATNDHNSPWVTTVAASTQARTFRSTVTLNGGGGATLQIAGATITAGIGSPLPVVLASAPPYNNVGCTAPAPPGLFTGKIVACERGPGRIIRGFNVRQGGAVGMILYNATALDVMTDNHWLPTVHITPPESQQLLAFLAANPGATASFPQGSATTWQGDRVTYFSSRGPGGDWLKPDVTAPGLHILAANTPTPEAPDGGPPGNLFQAIAGTSMSAPHVTGSAALVAALHPTWTPGQIKSALETTAKFAGVTKSDGVAPADPFDVGGGRIDLTKAGDPGLTFDETAANYVASGGNAADAHRPQHALGERPEDARRGHDDEDGQERHEPDARSSRRAPCPRREPRSTVLPKTAARAAGPARSRSRSRSPRPGRRRASTSAGSTSSRPTAAASCTCPSPSSSGRATSP